MPKSIRAVIAALAILISGGTADCEVLITESEAALPDAAKDVINARGGISPGPTIKLVSPSAKELDSRTIESLEVHSPFTFQLDLNAHSGSSIDWKTFTATYLKSPEVILNDRLIPHKTNKGIVFPNAEMPPGVHNIKIEVSDMNKQRNWKIIRLIVKKP